MKYLIVNGDDFGLTPLISKGIVNAYKEGILTSTSLLATEDGFENAVELSKENPHLGIGIHLVLIEGRPVCHPKLISHLVDENGMFRTNALTYALKVFSHLVPVNEVESEWRAQIEKILNTGIKVTHMDSHKHLHVLPPLWEITAKLCEEYRIPAVRIPFQKNGKLSLQYRIISSLASQSLMNARKRGIKSPDSFYGMDVSGTLDEDSIIKAIRSLPDGISELMAHPGYLDSDLVGKYSWTYQYNWDREQRALCSMRVKHALTENKVHLINYKYFDHI